MNKCYLKYVMVVAFCVVNSCPVFAADKLPEDEHREEKSITTDFLYSYFKDSDEVKAIDYGQRFSYAFNKKWSTDYTYVRKLFREPFRADVNENQHRLSVKYQWDWYYVKADYVYRDFFKVDDSHDYALEAVFPLYFLESVTLIHRYQHVDTARAILTNSKYYANAIGIDQNLVYNFSLSAFYERDYYVDSNRRDIVRGGLFYKFFEEINLKLGYEYVFYNAKESNINYWTPKRLKIHQMKLKFLESFFNDQLSTLLIYSVGRAEEIGAKRQLTQTGLFELRWKVKKHFEFFLHYNISNTPTYDDQTIQAGFMWKF